MFMVASAVCWILTEPSLGRVSALESHSIEYLMVKTKYTRTEKELLLQAKSLCPSAVGRQRGSKAAHPSFPSWGALPAAIAEHP